MRSLVFLLVLESLALAQGGLGTVKTYLLERLAVQKAGTAQLA